ncbi:MAG TPA: MFS transporter [Rhizobiaceae bacterium]|nr:MFS transporter [Rhizobiaceae bacterium]
MTTGLVIRLGTAQLICWGISYYLIGVFGQRIADEFNWSMTLAYSGLSGALVVMGLTSGFVGRLIDRHGGRTVMTFGSLLMALACVGLSRSWDLFTYNTSWACLGLAMRMTLYEAAFAALAWIGGRSARRAMSQITLLGGLASTAFWPIGHALASAFGWRDALLVYAGFALLTAPLHWSLPARRASEPQDRSAPGRRPPLASTKSDRVLAGALFVGLSTAAAFLNSGISAHMIGIMSGLGMGAGLSVWVSTLRGIGQSGARLCEVLFGSRMNELSLGILASAGIVLAFLLGQFSGASVLAGATFALAYGAGNGLMTIARGTQPLVLFDPCSYGALSGWLLAPGFFVSALAPVVYAAVIETVGETAALQLSLALACVVLACAVLLWWRFRKRILSA